ncbi:phosphatase PAP2 family protein [Leptospira interrogans]
MQINVSISPRADTAFSLTAAALLAGIVASATFLLWPDLDLLIARLFVREDGSFSPAREGWLANIRDVFKSVYVIFCVLSVVGLALAIVRSSRQLRTSSLIWAYLILCLSIGPGVVANLLLKDQWGRARPSQVVDFGGTKQFSPPLVPVRQCERNCSFISGEASAMFAPFFAVALIVPQWSGALMIAGIVTGFAAGLIRMAQGAHFLSDVVFAGIFMALTAAMLHRLVLGSSDAKSLRVTLSAASY